MRLISRPACAASLRQRCTSFSSSSSSGESFFSGWRSMPGTSPATSQLDWLISMTAISVLSWSKAVRDRLRSFGCGMGHSIGLLDSAEGGMPSPLAPYHLHLLAEPGAAQQNLRRQGVCGAPPPLRQPGRGAAAAGGGGGWAHRDGPGGLLPPSGGAGGQGQGGHRDGAQDRRSLLQHAPPRHGLRRSGRLRLRGTLPAAGPEQSPTPGQVARIRLAEGRPCLSCNSCFLGTRTYLVLLTGSALLIARSSSKC